MKPIVQVAEDLGIPQDSLNLYGKWKAKISLEAVKKLTQAKRGKLILVTAMTPTSFGEGKTVTAIGLGMSLSKLGHRRLLPTATIPRASLRAQRRSRWWRNVHS